MPLTEFNPQYQFMYCTMMTMTVDYLFGNIHGWKLKFGTQKPLLINLFWGRIAWPKMSKYSFCSFQRWSWTSPMKREQCRHRWFTFYSLYFLCFCVLYSLYFLCFLFLYSLYFRCFCVLYSLYFLCFLFFVFSVFSVFLCSLFSLFSVFSLFCILCIFCVFL